MNDETISALENPALAQELVQAALSMSVEEEVTEPEAPAKATVTPPPSGEVKLLAGLYNSFTGDITNTAEIRELNGVDEEALSKITDYGRGLLAILQRGTVKIGEEDATKDVLDQLLSGDREYLIMKIRIATFGEEIELNGPCPHCETENKFVINLEDDVKLDRLEDPSERSFAVNCKVGEVIVEYPTGATQRKLITATDKTAAELDSMLLRDCILSINGVPLVNADQVKQLSMQDRRTLLTAITTKNPGPDLASLEKSCPSCGLEVPIPLSLADLFRV